MAQAMLQQAAEKPLIGNPRAQTASNSLPLHGAGIRLLKVIKPPHEGLSAYSKHPDKLAGTQAVGAPLSQRHHHKHRTPPVDAPADEKTGFHGTSSPASLIAAAQTLSDTVIFWNVHWTTPWFASIIGLMKWAAAMRTSFLLFTGGKIGIDEIKKVKQTGLLEQFW